MDIQGLMPETLADEEVGTEERRSNATGRGCSSRHAACALAAASTLLAFCALRWGGGQTPAPAALPRGGGLISMYGPGEMFREHVVGLPGMPPPEPGADPSAATPAVPTPAPVELQCRESEEMFQGLCYRTCRSLTFGQYPMRSAPNACCRQKPCLLPTEFDIKGLLPCQGYAVNARGKCPHGPGQCEDNEELIGDQCYKQCALLTNGAYPFRIDAVSCCQTKPPCFNIFHVKTDSGIGPCSGFSVGGGVTDVDRCPHSPLV